MKDISLINVGLADKNRRMSFVDEGEVSHIGESESTNNIKLVSLDDALKGEKISCIKLDIEGWEKETILGAKQIIKEQRPNLMISIYHKMEDIFEIPLLLLEYNENYQFSLGHYSIGNVTETVLYAFVGGI